MRTSSFQMIHIPFCVFNCCCVRLPNWLGKTFFNVKKHFSSAPILVISNDCSLMVRTKLVKTKNFNLLASLCLYDITKLPLSPHAFPWFSSKTKNFICSIFRDVSFTKQLQRPPSEWILLKLDQNVPNR